MHYRIQIIDTETNTPRYGWITPDRKKAYKFINSVQQILNPDWYYTDVDMILDYPIDPCDDCIFFPCSNYIRNICKIKKRFLANPKDFQKI